MENKNKWINSKTQVNQVKIYTIIGTLLGVLGVISSIANNMPFWQIIIIVVLTLIILFMLIWVWLPNLFFLFWFFLQRKKSKVLI